MPRIDTGPLIWEELEMLNWLRDRRGQRIKTWTLINTFARQWLPARPKEKRPVAVALVSRLLKEKKIVRHRKSDTIRISEIWA